MDEQQTQTLMQAGCLFLDLQWRPDVFNLCRRRVDTKANSLEKSQIKVSFDGILSLGETRGGKTIMYLNWILYE